MALGVDTASYLTDIDWTAFEGWAGEYPSYAGRYFGGGYDWESGEFSSAYAATGGTLSKIIPLQGDTTAIQERQETSGSAGFTYGQEDAQATCDSIKTALTNNELQLPTGGVVALYMDVEDGVALTVDYWSGWANAVFTYKLSDGSEPFSPCIYTRFVKNSSGMYVPQSSVAQALNSSCASYPTEQTLCYGLWSNEPEPCSYCTPPFNPDWTVFGPVTQVCGQALHEVYVELYQFAERSGCVNTCNVPDFAGKQNLDLDSDNSGQTGAQQAMLVIVP